MRYLTNSVYRSSHAFGSEIEVYHSYLGNDIRVLPLEFGIQNVGGGEKMQIDGFVYTGCESEKGLKMGFLGSVKEVCAQEFEWDLQDS